MPLQAGIVGADAIRPAVGSGRGPLGDAAKRLAEIGEGVILGEQSGELARLGAPERHHAWARERPVEDECEVAAARGDRTDSGRGSAQTLGVFTPQTDYLAAYVNPHHRRPRSVGAGSAVGGQSA
jgi:hypothetical protein